MQSYTIRVIPEFTTIRYHETEYPRQYNLRSSNQDRYEFLNFLMDKWEYWVDRANSKRAKLEKVAAVKRRKARAARQHPKSDKTTPGTGQTTSFAAQILKRRQGKRLSHRHSTVSAPSPLRKAS